MLDALKQRLEEIETAYKALPDAAIAIANQLRKDVSRRRGAAKKRLTAARKEAKRTGGIAPQGRTSSGIAIKVIATDDRVTITASDQVQHFARQQAEPDVWMDLFAKKVKAAAEGSGA